MEEKLNVLIIGLGARGNVFVKNIDKTNLNINIKAIADKIKERRDIILETHKISKENIFETGEEALSKGEGYDFVYIATPDKDHYRLAIMALEKGYNVLLEKPMATNAKECIEIINTQEKTGKSLAICHILRYSPFFQKIKAIVSSEELGKIKNINLIENVGYWHFAHSYVRGNWRKESDSGPIILTKSCHDLDLISWLVNSEPETIFSSGNLKYFVENNSPNNYEDRCIICPIQNCIFDARRLYLEHDQEYFPHSAISLGDSSEEGRTKAIREGIYGRCVYKCDNDVCDVQDVIIDFKNDVRTSFLLRWGGDQMTRKINIQFEKGELNGDLYSGLITKTKYKGRRGEDEIEKINTQMTGGHGGGDSILIQGFADSILSKDEKNNLTSAKRSLQSHLLAFAAEKSRKSKQIIDFKEYLESLK